MMRFINPLILIVAAVGIFFKFTDPIFAGIGTLRVEQATLNNGLDNAKKLRQLEQDLLQKYNAMDPADRDDRLNKLLPDNVDNVRLIIDINNVAKPYGMTLKNVQIKTEDESAEDSITRDKNNSKQAMVGLSFSVSGDYNSFQSFLNDLAHSLRLADVTGVSFAANDKGVYDYKVEIKTYWLK